MAGSPDLAAEKEGRSPVIGQDEPDEEGLVRVTFADNTRLEFPVTVLEFDRNTTIRQNLSDLVRPLAVRVSISFGSSRMKS